MIKGKKFISFIMVLVLCFTIVAVPLKTDASAEVATIVIATTALICSVMGLTMANQGQFREACRACAESLTDDVKDSIEDFVIWENNRLVLTAFVASNMFDKAWSQIKSFFNGGSSGSISVGDAVGGYISPAFRDTIHSSSATIRPIPNELIALPFGQNLSFTNINGEVITFHWLVNSSSQYYLEFLQNGERILGGYGYSTNPRYIIPVLYNGSLYLTYCQSTSNSTSLTIWSPTSNANWAKLRISEVPIASVDIDYNSDASAIPDDAVKDAFKEKATSAGGVQIGEDSKILTEVFGDATTADDAMETTQTDVLTETGVIEAVDTLKYPILDNYKAVSGDLRLQDVFPFCIPFDVKDLVTGLRAARRAPSFEWRLYVPNVVDYTFNIDLSNFDTIATLLRTLELLAFTVGLALATRRIIRI